MWRSPAAAGEAPAVGSTEPAHRQRPLLRDFLGLNVHTVKFRPALYAPVCRRLRDYHPMEWDFGKDSSKATQFPMTVNGVDWGQLYGSWTKAGYDIDACLMFDPIAAANWKDPGHNAEAYGQAFARYFGPSGANPPVSSVEIGNEPSKYSNEQYRAIFEGMARGLRAGDARLKIVTCAMMMTGKTDPWSKPMSAITGLEDLYDVLNIHSYPFKDKWPTWRRSYPEDPTIPYFKAIEDLIHWRDAHAPGKEVWLTEFGYDSSTKPAPAKGPWSKWVGVTDEQQAIYIVRSFLCLSAMDVDRAYLYFFNDEDEPQLHAASGITRHFQPKPSFYAMSHLYRALGDFRFVRTIAKTEGGLYCFEYGNPAVPAEHVYVAWSATEGGKSGAQLLPLGKNAAGIHRAERLTLSKDEPLKVDFKLAPGGISVEVGEAPVFLFGP